MNLTSKKAVALKVRVLTSSLKGKMDNFIGDHGEEIQELAGCLAIIDEVELDENEWTDDHIKYFDKAISHFQSA